MKRLCLSSISPSFEVQSARGEIQSVVLQNKRSLTFGAREESFGMRITMGSRFSVGRIPLPFAETKLDLTINAEIGFIDPFCPLARAEVLFFKLLMNILGYYAFVLST
jgi:hypothetical protein